MVEELPFAPDLWEEQEAGYPLLQIIGLKRRWE